MKRLRWLGVLTVVAVLVAGVVSAQADTSRAKSLSPEAAAYLQTLQAQRAERLIMLKATAVDDPENWSYVWENEVQRLLDGAVPGFDASTGSSLVYAWFIEVSPRYHKPGDYMPLLILRRDGSEVRVAIHKSNGSIQVIRMVPSRGATGAAANGSISWEVAAHEVP